MFRYTPVASTTTSPSTPTRRSSLASLRRPSFSSFRRGSQPYGPVPDPDEMDAAFDGPDDEGETHGLLGTPNEHVPGEYEPDYTLPPPSPPPFQPYSSHNPAPGNTNGLVPSSPPIRPNPQRHFLGGILPTSFLSRQSLPAPGRMIGAGQTGIFSNLSARPDNAAPENRTDNSDYVPEIEQKEGPPSYQMAMRDAVPTYWDTTVVLPSSTSPFGPLSSSISGDEILIDGMPSGNFFGFFWNLIVSVSFQFVGFLLTYVLHTTHAAKYGSRAGLGITLIQFGLNMRSKAEELISSGEFPHDPNDPPPNPNANQDETSAENALKAFWGPGSPWPATISDPNAPKGSPPVVLHDAHEAELFATAHNTTLNKMLDLPSALDVGKANEYFSFVLMSLGWFLVLTSIGGWWRVKRFERGLRSAQRGSEAAQAAANRGNNDESVVTTETTSNVTVNEPGPMSVGYYSSAFSQALRGARGIQRGFLGMHGRPMRGQGHTPLPTDEHELLDAQGFGLEPMASEDSPRRTRGLWGV